MCSLFFSLFLFDGLLMSLAVGENPSPKTMGFDKEGSATDSEASETKTPSKIPRNEDADDRHHPPGINRKASESSLCPTEDEDDDDEEEREIELGPKCSLKEQLEKDKVRSFVPSLPSFTNLSFSLKHC